MNIRKKKSSWIYDKFIKAKIENDKKVNSFIKHNDKNKESYNLIIKDSIMSEKIKKKNLLKDVQKRLNSLSINRDSVKDIKNENEIFLKHFSNIKTFKKNYIKSYNENIENYEIVEDLVLKYKSKGYKIPKLSQINKRLCVIDDNIQEYHFSHLVSGDNDGSVNNSSNIRLDIDFNEMIADIFVFFCRFLVLRITNCRQ